jgi:hypothetical protein
MTSRRKIEGYEYEAGEDGLIWRIGSVMPLKQIPRKSDGRLVVNLCRDGVMRQRPVHQLIAETFHGSRPPGLDACHWDGNILHNSSVNLYWGTKTQNFADSIRHGTNKEVRKTECPRGHRLVEPNLRPRKKGVHTEWRECLACHSADKSYFSKKATQTVFPRSSPEFKVRADGFYRQLMGGGH